MEEEINTGTHYYQPDTFTGIYNGRKTLCKEEFTSCEIINQNQQLQKKLDDIKEIYNEALAIIKDEPRFLHYVNKVRLFEKEILPIIEREGVE